MKQFFASLLTCALLLGLLPTAALAVEENLGPEGEYSLDGGNTWTECDEIINVMFDDWTNYKNATEVKLRLLRDITYDETGPMALCLSGQRVEVDGQGHIIKRDRTCSAQFFSLDAGTEGAQLTLKNITLDGGAVWNGEDPAARTNTGVTVNAYAHLIYIAVGEVVLDAGTVLQNNDIPVYGGAVAVNGGKLTMKAGSKIQNNASTGGGVGGGVCVVSGSFSMEGGEIVGNAVSGNNGGGGVYINTNCSCTISDGEIKNNYAGNNGGGICTNGTFSMAGGSIAKNKSTGGGGGVSVLSGNATINGGSITRNSITGSMGGGVLRHNGSLTLTIGGNLTVTDNTAQNGSANNVYLPNGKTITVDTLADGAQIGVTTAVAPTEDTPTRVTVNAADAQYFSSDNPLYIATSHTGGAVYLALILPCTVSFDTGGGEPSPTSMETNSYGKLDSLPEVSRDGYTFVGWFTEQDGGTQVTTDTVLATSFSQTITLYARWLKNHTVSFMDGNTELATEIVVHGSAVAKPNDPAKTGYTFGGWYKDEDCKTAWSFESDTVTGDINLYAKWTVKNSGGGSGGSGGSGGGSVISTYPITIKGSDHGKVASNSRNASSGSTVTLTATPDEGYRLEEITVTDSTGRKLELTSLGSGKYSFKMPAWSVVATAIFREEAHNQPWVNPFTDVSEGDWYYEAVRFVQERGLMGGYGDGRFGSNNTLSRAQLAQILFNKEGRPGVNYLLTFSDVAGEAWYTEAIRWAASQGIVGGYGNGMFGPNDPITREQLAVMLWRYSGSPAATDQELPFTDTDKISGGALEAMRWAVENGIMDGYGDGRLGPKGQATRAQAAQMLKNFVENQEADT